MNRKVNRKERIELKVDSFVTFVFFVVEIL